MRQEHNKLVRDKIPEIIKQNGGNAIVRVLDDDEYKKELLKKVVEEGNELMRAEDRERTINEIADIQEVLMAVKTAFEIKEKEVEEVQTKKRTNRGGFGKKIFLEYTE